MRVHKLKTWPEFFSAAANRRKTFEIRENDREFKEGDYLILEEFDPDARVYSGRQLYAEVSYVTTFEQKTGWVVMAFQLTSPISLAYDQGILAGVGYFESGVRKRNWNYPERSPYPSGTPEAQAWTSGFHDGADAAEASYESGFTD